MSDLTVRAGRVAIVDVGPNRHRIAIDDQVIGPLLSKRAANVVRRWLEGGALEELEGGGGSKLERTLRAVDVAADAVTDILRNGLR